MIFKKCSVGNITYGTPQLDDPPAPNGMVTSARA